MPKKRRVNSASRMREAGKRPVQLWVTGAEYDRAQREAWRLGLSLAEFFRSKIPPAKPPQKTSEPY